MLSTSLFRSKQDKVRFSKKLSGVLRHNAESMGLHISPDGYISVRDLLNHSSLINCGYQFDHVMEVVATCDKQRFEMKTEDRKGIRATSTEEVMYYIRARQGHSIATVKEDGLLELIIDPATVPFCYHGTYSKAVESIKLSGLSRMRRNHIHLISCFPRNGEVISGMRQSADIIVTIDVTRAMAAGIPFYRSSNDVILSPGLNGDGIIPPEFISDISERHYCASVTANTKPSGDRHIKSSSQMDDKKENGATSSNPSFTHYCVIDFEATCVQDGDSRLGTQEIIEFPAVVLSASSLEVVTEFHSYIRPVFHPQLSAFCTQLTGIRQEQVDSAPVFTTVLEDFNRFLANFYSTNEKSSILFVTCGDWDLKTMLPAQCRASGLAVPASLHSWMNIKTLFSSTCRDSRSGKKSFVSMESMLAALGLDLIGHHHSGIDDSRNIARILIELVGHRRAVPQITSTDRKRKN